MNAPAPEPSDARRANIEIERARMAGAMRTIRDLGGVDALRSITATELERLTVSANDNRKWIG